MSTTKEKPSYEELEKENKQLKKKVRQTHFYIGAFLKSLSIAQAELIIGSEVAYKTEHTILFPDFENENLDYIISHHTR